MFVRLVCDFFGWIVLCWVVIVNDGCLVGVVSWNGILCWFRN